MKEEEHIIERSREDPNAFGQLYDLYYPRILSYAFRVTGDYSIACDITAETFAKAFMKLNSFKWKGISISSWIYKIASNELNQFFRNRKYRPVELTELQIYSCTASSGRFSDEMNETYTNIYMTEEFKKLHSLLRSLPSAYQKVIALRYFEEKSIKEISEILGKKEGTVKSLISRGIDRLRNMLELAT